MAGIGLTPTKMMQWSSAISAVTCVTGNLNFTILDSPVLWLIFMYVNHGFYFFLSVKLYIFLSILVWVSVYVLVTKPFDVHALLE